MRYTTIVDRPICLCETCVIYELCMRDHDPSYLYTRDVLAYVSYTHRSHKTHQLYTYVVVYVYIYIYIYIYIYVTHVYIYICEFAPCVVI